jgi:adenine phosphoribosyltransferase
MQGIKEKIRAIPDYPKPGIMFRDITTLLQDARGFRKTVDEMVQPLAGTRIDKVVGIEARGFILGGAIAHQLSIGFVPVRKRGKLPWKTLSQEYQLEYGTDSMRHGLDGNPYRRHPAEREYPDRRRLDRHRRHGGSRDQVDPRP